MLKKSVMLMSFLALTAVFATNVDAGKKLGKEESKSEDKLKIHKIIQKKDHQNKKKIRFKNSFRVIQPTGKVSPYVTSYDIPVEMDISPQKVAFDRSNDFSLNKDSKTKKRSKLDIKLSKSEKKVGQPTQKKHRIDVSENIAPNHGKNAPQKSKTTGLPRPDQKLFRKPLIRDLTAELNEEATSSELNVSNESTVEKD